MKNFIISTLEALLTIVILVMTLGGFWIFGNANPMGDFDFIWALIGGLIGLCMAALFTGIAFTLLRIKELLEQLVNIQGQESRANQPPESETANRLPAGMVTLYDNRTQAKLGVISETTLHSLLEYVHQEEGSIEDTVIVTADAIGLLETEGIDRQLTNILRSAIGNRAGMELRWE